MNTAMFNEIDPEYSMPGFSNGWLLFYFRCSITLVYKKSLNIISQIEVENALKRNFAPVGDNVYKSI